jgi:hypothetical protein
MVWFILHISVTDQKCQQSWYCLCPFWLDKCHWSCELVATGSYTWKGNHGAALEPQQAESENQAVETSVLFLLTEPVFRQRKGCVCIWEQGIT